MLKVAEADVGAKMPNNGDLTPWAQQGVLLLNTVLTVRQGEANSHKDRGWERFTRALVEKVKEKQSPVVFLNLGKQATATVGPVPQQHRVVNVPHPSPLNRGNPFAKSRPFSTVNEASDGPTRSIGISPTRRSGPRRGGELAVDGFRWLQLSARWDRRLRDPRRVRLHAATSSAHVLAAPPLDSQSQPTTSSADPASAPPSAAPPSAIPRHLRHRHRRLLHRDPRPLRRKSAVEIESDDDRPAIPLIGDQRVPVRQAGGRRTVG